LLILILIAGGLIASYFSIMYLLVTTLTLEINLISGITI